MSQIVLILLLITYLLKVGSMDMIWILFGFFIFVTLIFVVLAVAFPEWFGITGKKALEIQKHQEGDDNLTAVPSQDNKS